MYFLLSFFLSLPRLYNYSISSSVIEAKTRAILFIVEVNSAMLFRDTQPTDQIAEKLKHYCDFSYMLKSECYTRP